MAETMIKGEMLNIVKEEPNDAEKSEMKTEYVENEGQAATAYVKQKLSEENPFLVQEESPFNNLFNDRLKITSLGGFEPGHEMLRNVLTQNQKTKERLESLGRELYAEDGEKPLSVLKTVLSMRSDLLKLNKHVKISLTYGHLVGDRFMRDDTMLHEFTEDDKLRLEHLIQDRDNESPAKRRKSGYERRTCYGCGEAGHFQSDPRCPENRRNEGDRFIHEDLLKELSESERMKVVRLINEVENESQAKKPKLSKEWLTCYGCGQVGHFQFDPRCPENWRNQAAGFQQGGSSGFKFKDGGFK